MIIILTMQDTTASLLHFRDGCPPEAEPATDTPILHRVLLALRFPLAGLPLRPPDLLPGTLASTPPFC